MATTKYYTDVRGDKVAANYLSSYEKLRDKIANRIAKRWAEEQTRLAKIKADTVNDIQTLVEAAEKGGEIDVDRALRAKKRAEKRLAQTQQKQENINQTRAEAAMQRALARLKAAGRA